MGISPHRASVQEVNGRESKRKEIRSEEKDSGGREKSTGYTAPGPAITEQIPLDSGTNPIRTLEKYRADRFLTAWCLPIALDAALPVVIFCACECTVYFFFLHL
jgi:hypothetical protein